MNAAHFLAKCAEMAGVSTKLAPSSVFAMRVMNLHQTAKTVSVRNSTVTHLDGILFCEELEAPWAHLAYPYFITKSQDYDDLCHRTFQAKVLTTRRECVTGRVFIGDSAWGSVSMKVHEETNHKNWQSSLWEASTVSEEFRASLSTMTQQTKGPKGNLCYYHSANR